MTREEAKSKASIRIQLFDAKGANKVIDQIFNDHEAEIKAKDERIKELDCRAYHAEGYISDLHNEYPKHKKFLDTKARSIVAILFWRIKRQKAIYVKSFNDLGINNHNTSFYKGAYENSKMRFKQAYKMLKDIK